MLLTVTDGVNGWVSKGNTVETLSSIGIAKWAGSLSVEPLYSTGSGDAKVAAWRRADGELALETNGDPVFGSIAEAWDAGYNDGIAGLDVACKNEAYESGYTAGEAVYLAVMDREMDGPKDWELIARFAEARGENRNTLDA